MGNWGSYSNLATGGAASGGNPGFLETVDYMTTGNNAKNLNKKINENQWLDPADLWGWQGQKEGQQVEDQIAAQRAALQEQLDKQPEWTSITDGSGNLKNRYKLTQQGSNLPGLENRMALAKNINAQNVNTGQNFGTAQQGLSALQSRAFGTETSPWAKKLYEQQGMEQQQAMDDLSRQGGLNQNQMFNNMQAQGGLDASARQRLAQQNAKNQMFARQGLLNQGAQNRLGIGIQDEAQRMQLQQQMPGMQMQADQYNTGLQERNVGRQMDAGQFNAGLAMQKASNWGNMADTQQSRAYERDKFNIGNMIGDVRGKYGADQNAWNQGMQAYGSGQIADQMARDSVRKGGLLGMNPWTK